jgi:hypothetical protein
MQGDYDLISDLHKDVHGFRPTADYLNSFDSLDKAGKDTIFDELCEQLKQNEISNKNQAEKDVILFEELVAKVISSGATSRTQALDWLTQSETFWSGQCVEHFVWNQGILFTDYGKTLVKELLAIVKYKD